MKRLLCVLIAASTTASCANSPTPVTAPPKPQPAVLTVPCPPPIEPGDGSPDAAAIALKILYDQYGLCAGRVFELIHRLQGDEDGGN